MPPINNTTQPTTGINSQKIHDAILATLPNYVDAVHDLPDRREHYRGSHWLSEAEWDAAKEHTIEYNDVFREIIEDYPELQPEAILSVVSGIADDLNYSDEDKDMIMHNTRGVLHGMQHEVAFEYVLNRLPENFQVVTTDDEDDAHGADFKVRCPNGIVVSIDVKATERLVEEARERTKFYMKRHHKKAPANEIVLFSGFDELDFSADSPWCPTQEAIERVVPIVTSELRRASDRAASQLNASHR